ncbi:hypothetical protein BN2537_6741 [Streptomyces venezuelae]|nr:hypothetical protein BN2537_6741 [Streptomyces venezuelae]
MGWPGGRCAELFPTPPLPETGGSAPDPGPQTPDGLKDPAPPAFVARGSGGGAPGFGKGRGGGEGPAQRPRGPEELRSGRAPG